MLTLILADAELETIPPSIADHPQIREPAKHQDKDATQQLLDSSLHHRAMRDAELPHQRRRGRPDLTHLFLLTALDSALNLEGGLNTHIHTRHDEHITIDPATRIMRNYPRFKGLIETLLEEGRVGPSDQDPLLERTPQRTLPTVLDQQNPDHTIALTPEGTPTQPADRIPYLAGEHDHVAFILGGFPHGDYESPVTEHADEAWSIHQEPLSVWTVASEILVPWRHLTQNISIHRGPPPRR